MKVSAYQTIKFKCSYCEEGQYYSKGEAIQCPYCGSKDGQVLVGIEYIKDFNTYLQSLLLDCGSCGKKFNWQRLKDNNYRCPFCNWDSVRISQKEASNGIY